MRRAVTLGVLVMGPILAAGCVDETHRGVTTLWFDYTLTWHGDPEAGPHADPGDHCGRAQRQGDTLKVERWAWDQLDGADVLLVVDARLEGPWSTLGEAPSVHAVPYTVDPRVNGTATPIVQVAWQEGGLVLDGTPATLPAPVSYDGPGGAWTARGTMTLGPSTVTLYGPIQCE